MVVSLTGFMGCGKSSIGRMLQSLMPQASVIDLDPFIEKAEGRSIPEIFSSEGEVAFRQMEYRALQELLSGVENADGEDPLIISLGGGTVTTPECAALVHGKTKCIYLRTGLDTLVSRLERDREGRPVLAGKESLRERISSLMEQRSSIYEKTAHVIIDTDGRNFISIAAYIAGLIRDSG